MPVINGSMMRSSASSPRRRRKNAPRDSSPRALRRGISSSAPSRNSASPSVHWIGLSRAVALSARPYAALRPAIPPPTISTVRETGGIAGGRWSETGFPEVGRHDIQQCLDERRGGVEHGDPFQPHAFLARPLLELNVDVVEDFKVVRHEADGGHQDVPEAEAVQFIQGGFDCRAQPLFFRPALALIGKPPGRA